jgi:hypothetical protein
MNYKSNIRSLIAGAHFYQYTGISDTLDNIKKEKPKLYYTKIQWCFIVISILANYILPKGFSTEFSGYVVSGMSLFVGLFFTFILTIYDKFQKIDFTQFSKSKNEEKNKLGIRLKNYFKQITILSLYAILLSIICIILLSVTLLFGDKVNLNVGIITCVTSIEKRHFLSLVWILLLLVYRSTVLYFLFDFVLITIFLLSSFYDFIISEYNKIKLS